MGMFDYVVLPEPIPCPKCGAPIKVFQSKDRECLMDNLTPHDVHRFYTSCDNDECNTWVEFRRRSANPATPWRDLFEMVPVNAS